MSTDSTKLALHRQSIRKLTASELAYRPRRRQADRGAGPLGINCQWLPKG